MSDSGHKAANKAPRRPEKKRVPSPSQPAPPLFDDLLNSVAGIAPVSDWEAKPTVVTGRPVAPGKPTDGLKPVARKVSFTSPAVAQHASSLDEQMLVLLGGESFQQREPSRPKPTRFTSTKKRTSVTRVVWVTTLLAVGVLSAAVVSFGLEHKAKENAQDLATQLKTASATGQLVDAESLVRAIGDSNVDSAEQAQLLATTHAVLFRERDADPKRLGHIDELGAKLSTDAELVIKATLLSKVERIELRNELERISAASTDALPAYLLATALSQAGAHAEASKHFEVALDRDPSNLEHLATFARYCIETGKLNEAENTLEIMREVSPSAAWTRMIAVRLNRAQRTNRHPVPEPDGPETSAVGSSQLKLTYAIQFHADNKTGDDENLTQALELVQYHPSFVLDIVDDLLAVGWLEAAEAALKGINDSKDHNAVLAAHARLELARNEPGKAAVTFEKLFDKGYREPRFGAAYLKALDKTGAPKTTKNEVRLALREAWPELSWAAETAPRRSKKKRRKSKKRRRRRRSRR